MRNVVLGAVVFCLACVQSVKTPSGFPSGRGARPGALSPSPADEGAPDVPEPLVVRPGGYMMADLPLFSKVLFYLRENYYDKSRLIPRRMLVGALEFVQRDIPEIVIEPVPADAPDRVIVTVSGESRQFRIDRVDQPWSLRSKLQAIMRFAQARLQPVPQAEEGRRLLGIEMTAANGMLHTLDPHSVLIDPVDYAYMRGAGVPDGSVGLFVAYDAQRRIRATRVIPGSPAEAAGVRVRDRIVAINDEPTAGLRLEDVAARLRGPITSWVDVSVERDGARGVKTLRALRAVVFTPSMESLPRILMAPVGAGAPPAKVGYFHLGALANDAASSVDETLRDFARQDVRGIVVDLRGNQGGLYQQAVRVIDAFVKQGTMVSMVGVGARQRKDELARNDGREPEVPLALLIDHDTASGAEIIAAALRNLGRAVVMGQHSFGAGTVQVLFDVTSPLLREGDGAPPSKLGLKLTTAQFLAPGDVPIQLTGVAPDIELRGVTVARVGRRAIFRMEQPPPKRSAAVDASALPPEGRVVPPRRPMTRLDYLMPPPAFDIIDDESLRASTQGFSGDDFLASFAAEFLARVPPPGRAGTLAVAKAFVAEVAARESARIATAAAALKVDWRAGARTPASRLALKLEPAGGGPVRAGSSARFRGTVTNSGSATAFRVRAVLASDAAVFDGLEMPFGLVAAGETRTFELEVPIPPTAFPRTDLVRARLHDGDGDVATAIAETTIDTQARTPPVLSFTCQAAEAAPRAKAGKPASVRLVMQISNRGSSPAEQAEATLRRAGDPVDDSVVVKVGRWSGTVAPGAKKEASFVVDLPHEPRGGPVDLELMLDDVALLEPIRARMRIIPPDPPAGASPAAGWWQVTPATVVAAPPLVTVNAPAVASGETVRVTGEVAADTLARDVFIHVWNRAFQMPVRKVFYRKALVATARLPFEANVPIWPGSNVITVHARDIEGAQVTRTVVVLKRPITGDANP